MRRNSGGRSTQPGCAENVWMNYKGSETESDVREIEL